MCSHGDEMQMQSAMLLPLPDARGNSQCAACRLQDLEVITVGGKGGGPGGEATRPRVMKPTGKRKAVCTWPCHLDG